MKIGVNSRIYQNPNAGMPYTIERLYRKILEVDKKNSYIFFQTNKNKTIGKTLVYKFKFITGTLQAVLFDNYFVNKLAKESKVRVFHGVSNNLPFFKRNGVKYIVTIHDLAFLVYPQYASLIFRTYYKPLVGRALKNADVIVAVSQNTKKDIIKYYNIDKKKIKVIYWGVDEKLFASPMQRRMFKFKYFFSITTHPKRKNIPSVLEAMKNNKELKDLVYVIAGIIPEEQNNELKAKIKELKLTKRVKLIGYVTEKELTSLYQNAEFFIYPSYYEGFGYPVLEAMACRCPVICSNVSSLPEVTPSNKWLIDPNDINDISNSMARIVTLSTIDREKLINSNYEFAKRFNWQQSAKSYIDIFNSKSS